MLLDYLKLSLGNLTKRKLRSWLTMIGIFIGIAAVVSLIGLGEGLRNAIMSQFGAIGSDKITIQAGGVQFGPPGTGVVNPLRQGIEEKIAKVNGVEWAIPRMIKSGYMEFNDVRVYGVGASMPDDPYRREIEEIIGIKAYQGRLLKDGDRNKVLLGNNFKDEYVFGEAIQVGDTVPMNGKDFEVVGIMEKTGSFFIDGAALFNEEPFRELYDNTDEISIIVAKVKKGADINKVKEDVEKLLRKERNVKIGEEDFSVELAMNTLDAVNSTLFAVQLFVYIIASISLLVGGIGIMNTMYTAVVERTKEIGIMKSIGAKNLDIFFLFFVESGMLGMVGGLIGIIIGVSVAKGLAYLGAMQLSSDLIQAHISFWLIAGALMFSFVIGCIAGITPALRASRLHPVQALRYAK
jgi:putative ABC transport system permease protein